ncbi:cysteine desulfurase [bacterium]|jgi:cysteine desulfurase|nr:cysteine desulfurase [bacterium]
MSSTIYLDYNATTPLHPTVESAIKKGLSHFGNPSSLHHLGQSAQEDIESARESIAQFIGAKSPEHLFFTGSATESNNWVLKSAVSQALLEEKSPHIITSSIEHTSIISTCNQLEKEGVQVTYLPVDENGRINMEAYSKAITTSTSLVSIMAANNETGTIQPLSQLSDLAKFNGVRFHSDAVQYVGKVPLNVSDIGLDTLSLSAHKLYGPKGIGCLYCADETWLTPLLRGGSHERSLRAGTQNTLGIIGFSSAINWWKQNQEKEIAHMAKIKEHLIKKIKSLSTPVQIYSPKESLPNTLLVSFDNISGSAIMMSLDLEGICVSTGSACSTGSVEPSHVLLEMGLSTKEALSAVRLSWGHATTNSSIDQLINSLSQLLPRLSITSKKA